MKAKKQALKDIIAEQRKETKVFVQAKVDPSLLKTFSSVAEELGVTKSRLIGIAMQRLLDEHYGSSRRQGA